jgi:hypothetical protein
MLKVWSANKKASHIFLTFIKKANPQIKKENLG